MSDNESAPDAEPKKPADTGSKKPAKKEQALPDLTALNFGPAWAKKEQQPRRYDSADKGQRSKGGGRKEGGRSGDDRKGGGRREPRGKRDDRQQRGGDRRRDARGGGGQGRERRQRPPQVQAPDGIKARIMPIEDGLDAMAKQISATGRTHSVFDLAWLVLGGNERYNVIFESEKEPLYRSRSDQSVWLYQKECLDHFWNQGGLAKYYEEEVSEVEPPSGNFQSVARCGISRTLIGPPNHHAYQQNIMDLHREKFSNMSLEKYKQRIVIEHGEEAVQEWLDSMTKQLRWRPKAEPTEAAAATKDAVEDADQAESTPAEDAPAAEESTGESSESETPAETAETPTPAVEETVAILDSRRDVEAHFLAHGFEKEYETGKIMSAPGNISAKLISPGLLALQKNTVTEARRYPGELASILCRQMSGRHLAVFKWKKRLHCGPSRPKQVSKDLVMADRPTVMFKWVTDTPGGNIDAMWKSILPEDIDDETRHQWYHDLHWLINEGFVLLFADGTLHAAKELDKPAGKKSAKKAAKKSPQEKPAKKSPKATEPPKELTKAIENADVAPEKSEQPEAPAEPAKPDDDTAEPKS